MEDHILLAWLRALLEEIPDYNPSIPPPRVVNEWMGRAQAIVKRYSVSEGQQLEKVITSLIQDVLTSSREEKWGTIVFIVSRVKNDVELRLTEMSGGKVQAFGAGAVYDLFRQLTNALSSATKTLMIIDPYMDDQIFDRYLSSLPPSIATNLLVRRYAPNVKAAAELFRLQYSARSLEVRSSDKLHDRLIFADDEICWILGQSIKDAAISKPTYFGPLSPDVSQLKLAYYKEIWGAATAVFP
jgi:hypothetical protein